jgi:hypothetical protein
VLLVDDDHPELRHRREHRRARPERDPGAPRAEPSPLIVALAVGEAAVEHRDLVAETRAEARRELRRERDLGDQHQRPAPGREHARDRLEIDLGLAGAGDAVEQKRAVARGVDRRREGLERGGLPRRRRERHFGRRDDRTPGIAGHLAGAARAEPQLFERRDRCRCALDRLAQLGDVDLAGRRLERRDNLYAPRRACQRRALVVGRRTRQPHGVHGAHADARGGAPLDAFGEPGLDQRLDDVRDAPPFLDRRQAMPERRRQRARCLSREHCPPLVRERHPLRGRDLGSDRKRRANHLSGRRLVVVGDPQAELDHLGVERRDVVQHIPDLTDLGHVRRRDVEPHDDARDPAIPEGNQHPRPDLRRPRRGGEIVVRPPDREPDRDLDIRRHTRSLPRGPDSPEPDRGRRRERRRSGRRERERGRSGSSVRFPSCVPRLPPSHCSAPARSPNAPPRRYVSGTSA